jgi:hypothetical protein
VTRCLPRPNDSEWKDEYERTYRFLSPLVHFSNRQFRMYRWADFGAPGLFPELDADSEMYVAEVGGLGEFPQKGRGGIP